MSHEGTGKSFLLGRILEMLYNDPEATCTNRVAVTASTGIAALNIGGKTIYSFAGFGLGKGKREELVEKIKNSWYAKERWQNTEVLVIDEISMVDATLFDNLEYIARKIRRNNQPFGGIQLILCGDFFQLPPVPDKTFQHFKPSIYAFDAESWSRCISRPTFLTHVFRQKDTVFIDILTHMRHGTLTAEDIQVLESLSRPLVYADGIEPSQLFPKRQEVEDYNNRRLAELTGPAYQFPASDEAGSDINGMPIPFTNAADLLLRMIALPTLSLKHGKVGAQVLLIRNVKEDLVNGSLGKVINLLTIREAREKGFDVMEISDRSQSNGLRALDSILISHRQAWPLVHFENKETWLCPAWRFTIQGRRGNIEARRTQVPLILAWALSIHKSQGQTLSRVKVDLGHVFESGQAYVALSRATTMEGLEVVKFQASKVVANPRVISWQQFWENCPEGEWLSDIELDDDSSTDL
ncbi:hypothetical protein D9613_002070 [Agrocybe pediades]|uniref:ATP-dependent DNA helicase n=1 Tax=Agrocybe pediades TaxID=84607 RepID=A0A8H4R645_9AGAR|nr:hypothetical protein D9613_002070 [Agrocybe pediades]